MEKERKDYPLKGGNSKVYEVNETNREIIDNASQKLYSTDKKYALIYDETDRKKMELFWEFVEWAENRGFRSREDQIYDNALSELDPLDKSAIFQDWKICVMIPDENSARDDIQPAEFESEEETISCLFSRLAANTKGATPLAFGTIAEEKDGKAKGFATIQIMTDLEFGRNLKSASNGITFRSIAKHSKEKYANE